MWDNTTIFIFFLLFLSDLINSRRYVSSARRVKVEKMKTNQTKKKEQCVYTVRDTWSTDIENNIACIFAAHMVIVE